MKELLDAMQDSWSKWSAREGIRNLPEAQSERRTTSLARAPTRLPRTGHRHPLDQRRVVVQQTTYGAVGGLGDRRSMPPAARNDSVAARVAGRLQRHPVGLRLHVPRDGRSERSAKRPNTT